MLSDDRMDLFVGIWFLIGPILPSVLGNCVAYVAIRKKRPFLYRTLLITAILVAILPLYVLFSFAFSDLGKENQAGLIFVFLPFWTFLLFVVLFGVSCAAYLLVTAEKLDVSPATVEKFDGALVYLSAGASIMYFVLMAVLFLKAGV